MRNIVLASLLMIPGVAAATGALDSSFGEDGVAYSSSPLGGSAASGYGVFEDAAGRVLVAGMATDSASSPHMTVWRLTQEGSPDAAFGSGGVGCSAEAGWAWSAALDERGRLLAAGIKSMSGKPSARAVLERWRADGTRDPDFGIGGRAEAESPFGGPAAEGAAAGAGAAGVLLAGQAADGSRRMIPAIWTLRDDGSFDGSSSSASARRLRVPDGVGDARVFALLPRAAGGWWAAGSLDWRSLALWRIKADGSPDGDFGAGGLALSDGVGRALAQDGAGGVWAAGFAYREDGKEHRELAVLAHFAADGSTTSWTALEVPGMRDREAFALARAADGRLFVGGYADMGARPVRACVWALTPDGRPDRHFGRGGVLLLPPLRDGEERIYQLALDARGRLLATGVSRDANGRYRRAVWRFLTR